MICGGCMRVRPGRAELIVNVSMLTVLPADAVQRTASRTGAELRTVGGAPRKTDRGARVQLTGAARGLRAIRDGRQHSGRDEPLAPQCRVNGGHEVLHD